MAKKRLSMRKVREVLRLKHSGLSIRSIARACSIGKETVREYLCRASEAGLSWSLSEELDDEALEQRLFPSVIKIYGKRSCPNWALIHKELRQNKADYPIDSGLFLRVQPSVLSYQVTIDYRPEGEVGAIYCPGGGAFLKHRPEGKGLWKKDEYNIVRVMIKGQPATIKIWINGTPFAEYTDVKFEGNYRVPATGYIGIQVHPGSSWGKGNKVYFRKLMIKPLTASSQL